jgi:hypothetical protein
MDRLNKLMVLFLSVTLSVSEFCYVDCSATSTNTIKDRTKNFENQSVGISRNISRIAKSRETSADTVEKNVKFYNGLVAPGEERTIKKYNPKNQPTKASGIPSQSINNTQTLKNQHIRVHNTKNSPVDQNIIKKPPPLVTDEQINVIKEVISSVFSNNTDNECVITYHTNTYRGGITINYPNLKLNPNSVCIKMDNNKTEFSLLHLVAVLCGNYPAELELFNEIEKIDNINLNTKMEFSYSGIKIRCTPLHLRYFCKMRTSVREQLI